MDNKELNSVAKSLNYSLARGVLGLIEVVESKHKNYYALVPFHVVAMYSEEQERYVALNSPYTVYTYFCEPDIDDKVEIPTGDNQVEIFSPDILERMKSFHDYISKVLLLYDYKTGKPLLGVGHAFYAFVRYNLYVESADKKIDKRWFRRNLYNNYFLNISPFRITLPTEKSIEFATRRDDETKKQRIDLVNFHARTSTIPFDVRQKVNPKRSRQQDTGIVLDW
jgi:hypothetical protein